VSQKKTSKIIFVINSSNFTKSDNFWHKDGKWSKVIGGALIFHLT